MMKRRKGFSLVEAMIGIIIISIISAASWVSLGTLVKIDQTIRKSNKANYLIQKSQEELRKVARTMYDIVEYCDYSEDNPCGFDSDISEYFEGFERTIEVKMPEGSMDLKLAHIRINWEDMGDEQERHAVMLISRPHNPMPGNIVGEVYEAGHPETLIGGVEVTITRIEGAEVAKTISSPGYQRDTEINYNFTDDEFGRYFLNVGAWELKATHPSYEDYTHPAPVIVRSNQETRFDFEMQPNPEDGHITGSFYDVVGGSSVTFTDSMYVDLSAGGELADVSPYSNFRLTRSSFTFDIPFESSGEEKCFTVATRQDTNIYYNKGVNPVHDYYAGNFSCIEGASLNPDGWTSSIVRQSGEVHCSNPWEGSSEDDLADNPVGPIDRVCVRAGETIQLDILLKRVPTATIYGTIVDDWGDPVVGADMYIYYHSPGKRYAIVYDITDENGNYSVNFPAEQEFFPDEEAYYPDSEIKGYVRWLTCCNPSGEINKTQGDLRMDTGLWEGDSIIRNIILSSPQEPWACGSIRGKVTDSDTREPIQGALVHVFNVRCNSDPPSPEYYWASYTAPDTYTDANGDYKIHCDPNYALNATWGAGCEGFWWIRVHSSGYQSGFNDDAELRSNRFTTVNFSLIPEGEPTPTPTPTLTPTPTPTPEPTPMPTETGGL